MTACRSLCLLIAVGLTLAGCGTSPAASQSPATRPSPAVAANVPAPATRPAINLMTPRDVYSYGLGIQTLRNYKKLGMDLDMDLLIRGMQDAVAGKLALSESDIQNAMLQFQAEARVAQNRSRIQIADENKKAGEAFLAENKTKEGVVTLPSGLQYKVLKAGTGPTVDPNATVEVHYTARLIDGTEFDSSKIAKQPASLGVSDPHLIAGFREALRIMPIGATWELYIPSRLAYLDRGWGRFVGPNAALIYEVELLGIERPDLRGAASAPASQPRDPQPRAQAPQPQDH